MEQNAIKTPKNTAALQPKAKAAVENGIKYKNVPEWLSDDKFRRQLASALPKFLDTEHFVRSALTEFRLNPALAECSVPSVLGYFMQAAACGLEPASVLGQCYPVPFNNKKTGQKECQFLLSYRGMLAIARRSGEIASVIAEAVHEKDVFDVEYGLEPKLIHKPYMDGDPGKLKGCYVVVRFKGDGVEPLVKYMPKSEIDKHRARSKANSSGPWVTDYEEMAKKTVFRSVFKWLPVSLEQVMAVTNDGAEVNYKMDAKDDDDLLEIKFAESEEEDEQEEAAAEAVEDTGSGSEI